MDQQPLDARLCVCTKVSLESNSVQTLQKSFGWDLKPRPPTPTNANRSHIQAVDPVIHVRVCWIMETPNKPAWTKNVFKLLKLDAIWKKKGQYPCRNPRASSHQISNSRDFPSLRITHFLPLFKGGIKIDNLKQNVKHWYYLTHMLTSGAEHLISQNQ